MKRKDKKENGITLIALIVTIIIMLILAGVTINITIRRKPDYLIKQKQQQRYIKKKQPKRS